MRNLTYSVRAVNLLVTYFFSLDGGRGGCSILKAPLDFSVISSFLALVFYLLICISCGFLMVFNVNFSLFHF